MKTLGLLEDEQNTFSNVMGEKTFGGHKIINYGLDMNYFFLKKFMY